MTTLSGSKMVITSGSSSIKAGVTSQNDVKFLPSLKLPCSIFKTDIKIIEQILNNWTRTNLTNVLKFPEDLSKLSNKYCESKGIGNFSSHSWSKDKTNYGDGDIYPIKDGKIIDWDSIEYIWDQCYKSLKINP